MRSCGSSRAGTARRPWLTALTATAGLAAAACTGAAAGRPARAAGAATPAPPVGPALVLQVTPAPYQLPSGIWREVVLPSGPGLLIAGGLAAHSAASAAVRRLNPVTGRLATAGRLTVAAQDAAGAMLGTDGYLFGGRSGRVSVAAVQFLPAGHATARSSLPRRPGPAPSAPALSTWAGYRPPASAGPASSRSGKTRTTPAGAASGTAAPSRAVVPGRSVPGMSVPGRSVPGRSVPGRSVPARAGRRGSLAGERVAPVAAQLPRPRSGLAAVTIGRTAYLLGGYDGSRYDRSVLATTDGRHFRRVATLQVPVRNPAVAAADGQIWVFGGQGAAGVSSVIQRISPATGTAAVTGHLPRPVTGATALTLGGTIYVAGGQVPAGTAGQERTRANTGSRAGTGTGLVTTPAVLAYRPGRHTATVAGQLPVPVAGAGAAVLGGTGYLIGGSNGQRAVPTVTLLRLVRPAAALPPAAGGGAGTLVQPDAAMVVAGGRGGAGDPAAGVLTSAPWLAPAHGQGHLAPHSDPSVLPGDILIADNWNNRLLIVDPQGRIRWRFPRKGDLRRGQTFLLPDDAFFSPDGKYIVATEEEDSVISVISVARHRIVYRYGRPGVPGSGRNQVANPDDAMMTPSGTLITADIKNCRLLVLRPPSHRPRRIIGRTGGCWHNPPYAFGSPNGAFPATNGRYIITEINQDWAEEMSLAGHLSWAAHPPGVSYPSDTNEVYPGRYLTADYSSPGQVVEFGPHGRLAWRFGGLNHPSLAQPLPNGDILVNDDYNDRVIVIDPVLGKIVWQYGHTGVSGTRPGYLNDPDGVDLVPPNSMLITHAATMGRP
jgi:hypothetical protein